MRKVIPKDSVLVPKEAKRVFKGVIYDTYQWQQKMYDGSYKTFEMLKRPDTVKVIAVKDNKIVVLEQEQPYHSLFYDVPGGMHDNPKENELEAAKRELKEETGMEFKTWKLIDASQPHFKIEQFVYIFLATDFISKVKANPDAGEKITVKLLTLNELKKLIKSPKNRYLPAKILDPLNSVDEILKLPEYLGEPSPEL